MSDPRDTKQPYEAPAIDEREVIDTPLVAIVSGEPTLSAAFHPADDDYEPPAIEERTQVDTPLIGATSPGPCLPTAAFHPADDADH